MYLLQKTVWSICTLSEVWELLISRIRLKTRFRPFGGGETDQNRIELLPETPYAHQESPETDESHFFDTFGALCGKNACMHQKGTRNMAGRNLAII